jgi:uncharacterized protein
VTVLDFLRRHPLVSYFVMAFALSWLWFLLAFDVWHLELQGIGGFVGPLVGPTLSAFVMTAVTQGRSGVLDLLRRMVRWRVGPHWYLVALVAWPALMVAAVLALPGGLAALRVPLAGFALTYLGIFVYIFAFGGPLGEEPGWRGFALPGLQERLGPLAGSLLLGVLHGIWHLPLYLLIPGYNGAPPSLPGIAAQFLVFVVGVTAGSVTITWLFNNTRGSVLMAMLYHATTNCVGVVIGGFFPGLDVREQLGLVRAPLQIAVALLVIVATRGRLSYRAATAGAGVRPLRR